MTEATDERGKWVVCSHCHGQKEVRSYWADGKTYNMAKCAVCDGKGGHFEPDASK
jgi:DnaJ-class molecular chaperone